MSFCLFVIARSGPVAGASPGLVIASPSTSSPDYFYTWTRDSAITFLSILDRFLPSDNSFAPSHHRALDHGLESLVREYVASQAKLQMVDNPSGGFGTGGLGEPKFEVNGTAFKGSWGRPQNVRPLLSFRLWPVLRLFAPNPTVVPTFIYCRTDLLFEPWSSSATATISSTDPLPTFPGSFPTSTTQTPS
jgi:hypothetical protein